MVRAGARCRSLASARLIRYRLTMADAIPDIQKKRGRPAVGSTGVLVKLPPEDLELLDAWIAAHEPMSRPEAMRRILKLVATGAAA